MIPESIPDAMWICGPAYSGKTTRLVRQFVALSENLDLATVSPSHPPLQTLAKRSSSPQSRPPTSAGMLVFAATGDNRLELTDRLIAATEGRYPVESKTPLGFFEDEVILFWPLLVQQLNLQAQFPIRLHPETEQELATQLWQHSLEQDLLLQADVSKFRLVRQLLDLIQLAAFSGRSLEEIPEILSQGLPDSRLPWDQVGQMLLQWRNWCLERGLLTYGITAELYWRYLLPESLYQQQLLRRYQAVLADDVDNYPAIACHLFDFLLNQGLAGAFTYNPDGAVRLGLGADPQALAQLQYRCQIETLTPLATQHGAELGPMAVQIVSNPFFLAQLPERVQAIQTTSRAELLRRTSEAIITSIQLGQVQPQDIAVIAPGLDAIARYTLTNILTQQGIPVLILNDQHPLAGSAIVRALLTLLTLIYPGLGRLVDRDAITELLVVLSQKRLLNADSTEITPSNRLTPTIDFVRANLLADHCFEPHPDRPRLLPLDAFPRWDRLGYQASETYQEILTWVETQKLQLEQRLIPSPISILDRGIQQFLGGGSFLSYNQLATLRELIESAQHYWEVETRLHQSQSSRQTTRSKPSHSETVGRFIELLRSGTVTANPFPVRSVGFANQAVTLSSVFQYRSNRGTHRWLFLLDAGSNNWLSGSDVLFGAPLFLSNWSGRPLTETDIQESYEQRLHRILLDLFSRTQERIFLCYSDLAVSGQEQNGPLQALVNAAVPYRDAASVITHGSQ